MIQVKNLSHTEGALLWCKEKGTGLLFERQGFVPEAPMNSADLGKPPASPCLSFPNCSTGLHKHLREFVRMK